MSDATNRLILIPTDPRWHDFVQRPQASIFHHPAWSTLLADCYGYRAMAVAICGADGAIRAGCPIVELRRPLRGKYWVALPFTDHCAPLYRDDHALEALARWFVGLYRQGEIAGVEVRWALPDNAFSQATYDIFSFVRLDPDSDVVARRFHKKHRYELKKVREDNTLRIERGTNPDFINQFYRLHARTRQRLGLPVQPKRFFGLLGEHILEKGLGYIALAYARDECVAADVFLHWQHTITYKYSAGTDAARDSRANYLLMWDTIQWGCENGYMWLDLGRSAQSNTGLRRFKARWGAEETPLTYAALPAPPADSRQSKLLPIMNFIIRRSPVGVCQVMGRLFYKYVG